MRLRFWGVRGSVPWSTASGMRHGCNTPCVQVEHEATGASLILDAGSGIVGLGAALGSVQGDITIVLTHYHWDHVQGLPFFAPLYMPGRTVTICAPAFGSHDRERVSAIFESPFYPVPYDKLPSRPVVRLIDAEHGFDLGGLRVSSLALNHPGGALAFRVDDGESSFVYATDHEFGDQAIDERLGTFLHGASAAVFDAHFTPDELPAHRGWGHSDWRQCAEFAARQDVTSPWLFHHKPGRTDEQLDAIQDEARRVHPHVRMAREEEWFSVADR